MNLPTPLTNVSLTIILTFVSYVLEMLIVTVLSIYMSAFQKLNNLFYFLKQKIK
jgi:hypothetical protein